MALIARQIPTDARDYLIGVQEFLGTSEYLDAVWRSRETQKTKRAHRAAWPHVPLAHQEPAQPIPFKKVSK